MQIICKKCKVFARNANYLQEMQTICKKCKLFARNAKYLQEMQRICKNKSFLTSGLKDHLGGLGGSEQSHLTVFSPYISPYISPYMSGGYMGRKLLQLLP